MALQGSGQISFSQIENEFGQNGERSLGDYRTSQSVGELSNLPLDSGIPTSGQIKFSDFYSKRLNIIVDMHSGGDEFRQSAKNDKWNNNNLTVIGGFRSKKEDGSKIIVHVNKKFGSDKSSVNNCAVRTGSWNSSSSIQVDVGGEGQILGAGGDGGQGGVCLGGGQPGGSGTSGLGIDHNGVTVNVLSGGIIRAGFGGGGGGGGGRQTDKGSDRRASGGGGGGGAGFPAGNGGQPGNGCANGSSGSSGNETTAGDGGGGGNNGNQAYGASGGEGGQFGEAANGGGSSQAGGGSGGGDGAAIRRNSGFSVTINNSGTIQGDQNATGVS
jgi:hypothetical protein